MIVQCEHCHTKYRIADEKVKGKGVKVRCAKCENVFTVTPPEGDSMAQSVAPPQPPQEGPPAPAPGEVSGSTRDSDGAQGSPGLPPLPPIDSSSTSLEQTGDSSLAESTPSEQGPGGLEAPPSGEDHGEQGSVRPAHEMDQEGLVSPPPRQAETTDEGFEIEGTMREETLAGPGLPESKAGEGLTTASEDSETGWGNIAIGGEPPPDSTEGDFGIADSPDYEPPPPAPMEGTGAADLPGVADGSGTATSSVPTYQEETRKSSGGKKGLLVLLLLAALGAGSYFSYPTIVQMIQSGGQQPGGTLTPAEVQVKALTRTDGKIIYLVRGKVLNESAGNVGMVQVEAQFRNASGDVLSKATSYCGNLLEDGDLVRMDMNTIRSDLQNELGQSLSNSSIPSGQTVPFLVILDNPPAGVSKVTVSILSFKQTT